MKSKEYLEHICKICDNESCPYIHYENSRCSYYGFIKQDLDRLEKLEKENASLHTKVENVSSETEKLFKEFLDKENQRVKKELKQTKLNFKNSQIHSKNCYKKLKDKYLKTEEENKKLKEIIKENFGYSENRKECYFKYDNPVMEDEIKEVLENA